LEKAEALLKPALKLGVSHAGKNYNIAVLYEEFATTSQLLIFTRDLKKLGFSSHPSLIQEVKGRINYLR
jgi:hypothetical protein